MSTALVTGATAGIGESFLAELIAPFEQALPPSIKLAYLPSIGIVKLRLTALGEDLKVLKAEVELELQKVLPLIKSYIYGYEKDELAEVVGRLLIDKKATLAVAESCTGGLIAKLLTDQPGSSAFLERSVVAYANSAKMNCGIFIIFTYNVSYFIYVLMISLQMKLSNKSH